jgi:hypothetical protein
VKLTDPAVWKVVESSGKQDWIAFESVTLGKRKIAHVLAHESHNCGEHQPEADVGDSPHLVKCLHQIRLRENVTPTPSVASASHLNSFNQQGTIEVEQDARELRSSTLPSVQEATQDADSDSRLRDFGTGDTGDSNEALATHLSDQNMPSGQLLHTSLDRIDPTVNPTCWADILSGEAPEAPVSERPPFDFNPILDDLDLLAGAPEAPISERPPFDFNPIFDDLDLLEGAPEAPVSERPPFDFNPIFDDLDLLAGAPEAPISERPPFDFNPILDNLDLLAGAPEAPISERPPFDFNPIFDDLDLLEGAPEAPISERPPFDFNPILDNLDLLAGAPEAPISERPPFDFNPILDNLDLLEGAPEAPISERPPFDFNPILDDLDLLEGAPEAPISERPPFDFNPIFDVLFGQAKDVPMSDYNQPYSDNNLSMERVSGACLSVARAL